MTSYLVVRNKRTGYVTFVGRARVEGVSRTIEYVCGLGMMDQAEFKAFQKWAHSMKDQEMRKQMVLASPRAVEEKKEVTERVAVEAQKKTTVKRAPRKESVKKVKRWFPVPRSPKTHTERMMELEPERKALKATVEMEERYARMPKREKEERIRKLEMEKVRLRKEWRHWDAIISEGGLYASKHERAQRAMIEGQTARIDAEIKRLRR